MYRGEDRWCFRGFMQGLCLWMVVGTLFRWVERVEVKGYNVMVVGTLFRWVERVEVKGCNVKSCLSAQWTEWWTSMFLCFLYTSWDTLGAWVKHHPNSEPTRGMNQTLNFKYIHLNYNICIISINNINMNCPSKLL